MFDGHHIGQNDQGVLTPKTLAGEQLLKAFIDEQLSSCWMHIFFDSWEGDNPPDDSPAICLFFDQSSSWNEETKEYKSTLYWQPGRRAQNEDGDGCRNQPHSSDKMKMVFVRVRLVSTHPRKRLYERFDAPSPGLVVEWQLRYCSEKSLLAQGGSPLPLGEESWAAIPSVGDYDYYDESVKTLGSCFWKRSLSTDVLKNWTPFTVEFG